MLAKDEVRFRVSVRELRVGTSVALSDLCAVGLEVADGAIEDKLEAED